MVVAETSRLLVLLVAMIGLLPASVVGGSVPSVHGITVLVAAPLNATFNYTAYGSCDGGPSSVPFHSVISGGAPPYNYTWNFGDGSHSNYDADPIHTYADSFGGPFNVTMIVRDSTGATASDTQLIHFLIPPFAHTQPQPVVTPIDLVVLAAVIAAAVIALFIGVRKQQRR